MAENRIANFISYVFHPLFMPTWGVFLIFNLKTYLSFALGIQAKLLIYATVFLNTATIPFFASVILLKMGIISSFKMEERNERNIPFILTAISYYFSYYMLKQYNLPHSVYALMLGACYAVVIAIGVNYFWKISVHMIGIGGIIGAILCVGLKFQLNILPFLLPVVLVAGLIGFARLKLDAHTPAQVYCGLGVGFLTQYLVLGYNIG